MDLLSNFCAIPNMSLNIVSSPDPSGLLHQLGRAYWDMQTCWLGPPIVATWGECGQQTVPSSLLLRMLWFYSLLLLGLSQEEPFLWVPSPRVVCSRWLNLVRCEGQVFQLNGHHCSELPNGWPRLCHACPRVLLLPWPSSVPPSSFHPNWCKEDP